MTQPLTEEAYDKAWEALVQLNPFPATLGRICPHPCESSCSREAKDGTVSINAMERFLGDWGISRKLPLPSLDDERREETVGVVATMIKTLRIPYQSCVILLYKNGVLQPVLSETPYKDVLAMSHLLQLEETLIKEVVDTKKSRPKPSLSASSEGRIFKNERSVMCVPLLVSKECVGVIYVGSVNPNTHSEEHLKHLKMIAAFAAPSIKTAILFEDKVREVVDERTIREAVEAKNAQLAELQNMGQRMGATLKTDTTITVVSQSLKKMISQAQSVILFT